MSLLIVILLCVGTILGYTVDLESIETDYSKLKTYYEVDNEKLCQTLFEKFIKDYDKSYVDQEEKFKRLNIFRENLHSINKNNIRNPQAYYDISEYSDLTMDEFLALYTGFVVPSDYEPRDDRLNYTISSYEEVPESFDWRSKKVVTQVKNQAHCGSCWAFSTVGNIEGQYALKHKELIAFSEQQLVSCDRNNDGCDGGIMTSALDSLVQAGGIQTEKDYPYASASGTAPECKFDKSKIKAKILKSVSIDLSKITEQELKKQLIKTGPISIALASNPLHGYKGGLIKDCAHNKLSHAVLLVGYGKEAGQEYWVIKNSWGLTFGEKGYFRLLLGKNCLQLMNPYAASSIVA